MEEENQRKRGREKKAKEVATQLTCGSSELSHNLVGESYNMNHYHSHIKEKERKAKNRNRILCARSCDLFA